MDKKSYSSRKSSASKPRGNFPKDGSSSTSKQTKPSSTQNHHSSPITLTKPPPPASLASYTKDKNKSANGNKSHQVSQHDSGSVSAFGLDDKQKARILARQKDMQKAIEEDKEKDRKKAAELAAKKKAEQLAKKQEEEFKNKYVASSSIESKNSEDEKRYVILKK